MRASVLLVASLSLGSACGGNAPSPEADEQVGGPAENVVEVGLTEYAFDMPDEVTGGVVTFEAVNLGAQPHEMGFVAIEGSRGTSDIMRAIETGGFPDWTEDLAGVPLMSPGIEASMTRELDEGTYAFLCFLPTPQGSPHASEGMVEVFEVRGISDARPPERDLVITVTDDGFQVPEIGSGPQTIELVNEGTKSHEFAFVSFEPGKAERDLGRWFRSGYEGRAPAIFPGGLQSIPPNTSVTVTLTFESGRTYALEDFANRLSVRILVE